MSAAELPETLAELDRLVLPGITHWNHPAFFAYFPSNTSYASILGDLVAAGLGAQGMSWQTSPAATELEEVVMDWLRVDAALAGTAMVLPECRPLWRGIERADGLVFNPHKWMGVGCDFSAYYARDPEHLSG